mmetsp:Transcript_26342/g.86541  ORF Transcript_26342/g.86541 Transcript_26342/m.86541 type:complete len:808 (-) Transcript_26342:1474-3897(-)
MVDSPPYRFAHRQQSSVSSMMSPSNRKMSKRMSLLSEHSSTGPHSFSRKISNVSSNEPSLDRSLSKLSILSREFIESLAIPQLKNHLRSSGVSEAEIAACIERSQLIDLLNEQNDIEFWAVRKIQAAWRAKLDARRANKVREKLIKEGILQELQRPGRNKVESSLLDIFSMFSVQEIEFYREVFDECDKEGIGELLPESVETLFQDRDTDLQIQKLRKSIKKEQRDGKISFNAFLTIIQMDPRLRRILAQHAIHLLPKVKINQLHKMFDVLDEDGNGTIDMSELSHVIESLGRKHSVEEIRALLKEIGKQGDDMVVTFEEFVSIMSSPNLRLAKVFEARMESLQYELRTNVERLRSWRQFSAEINPSMRPARLNDSSRLFRMRAGCVPTRTIYVEKSFFETRMGESASDVLKVERKVKCREVQVLLVTSLTYPDLWILPAGWQHIPRSESGGVNFDDVQSPEDAAKMHGAEEAGVVGTVSKYLGGIKDFWKPNFTRWYLLEDCKTENENRQPLDVWREKELRKRKWFPLITEELRQDGEPPPRGHLGTKFEKVGSAAEFLLWRRSLYQALMMFVDGGVSSQSPSILHLYSHWSKSLRGSPTKAARSWFCLDAASNSLVLGVEASFNNDPRPLVSSGPFDELALHEAFTLFISDQPYTNDQSPSKLLKIVVGPYSHHRVELVEGTNVVKKTSLDHQMMSKNRWYRELRKSDQKKLLAHILYLKSAVSFDKTKWIATLVLPKDFFPFGSNCFVAGFLSFGTGMNRQHIAAYPIGSHSADDPPAEISYGMMSKIEMKSLLSLVFFPHLSV